MSTAIMPSTPLPLRRPVPSVPVATVFLPKEHGSWSLALEPLALGLLVAPSWAGGALAGAVLAGFFARRPLKAAVSPIHSARRQAARVALLLWSALAVVGVTELLVLAPLIALWPLLPVAGLGAFFLYFDAQGESREAAAEVAGSAAFACLPAALASFAGWSPAAALALAVVALARSVPAVLTVRGYLRLKKGGAPAGMGTFATVAGAALAVVALAARGLVPGIAAAIGAMLLLRSLWLLGPWRPDWTARRIGMLEAVAGLLTVALLAANWTSP